jgi:hypothetical protein
VFLLIFLPTVLPDLSDDRDYDTSPDGDEGADEGGTDRPDCNLTCIVAFTIFHRQSKRVGAFCRRLFQLVCPVRLWRDRVDTEVDRISDLQNRICRVFARQIAELIS